MLTLQPHDAIRKRSVESFFFLPNEKKHQKMVTFLHPKEKEWQGQSYWVCCQNFGDYFDCYLPDIGDAAACDEDLYEALEKVARKATWCVRHRIQTEKLIPKPSTRAAAAKAARIQMAEVAEFVEDKLLTTKFVEVTIDFSLLSSKAPINEDLEAWADEWETKEGYRPTILKY